MIALTWMMIINLFNFLIRLDSYFRMSICDLLHIDLSFNSSKNTMWIRNKWLIRNQLKREFIVQMDIFTSILYTCQEYDQYKKTFRNIRRIGDLIPSPTLHTFLTKKSETLFLIRVSVAILTFSWFFWLMRIEIWSLGRIVWFLGGGSKMAHPQSFLRRTRGQSR